MTNIFLIAMIIVFVYLEWNHRAKKDGSKEALNAFFFAGFIFAVGYLTMTNFGIGGLVGLLITMLLALVGMMFQKRP